MGTWLGWKDKEVFNSDQSFLFMRPFNVFGDFFQESKLEMWIKEKHLDQSKEMECIKSRLGLRDECLRELISESVSGNELIVVPVRRQDLELAENQRCSLTREGISNILYWSLDAYSHTNLLAKGLLTYHDSSEGDYKKVIREQPKVLLKLLNAGYNLWLLEASVIAVRDFHGRAVEYTKEPLNSDLVLATADYIGDYISAPLANTAMMYIRSSDSSRDFLEVVGATLDSDLSQDFQGAVQNAILKTAPLYTGIGTKSKDLTYPEGTKLEVEDGTKIPAFIYGVADLFFTAKERARIHFFDPLEFIDNAEALSGVTRLVHFSFESKNALTSQSLWLLKNGICPITLESEV